MLKLFRGDSRFNGNTCPEYFDEHGITIRLNFDVEMLNSTKGIRQLLSDETSLKTRYLLTGEYQDFCTLSFSTSRKTANYYLHDKNTIDLDISRAIDLADHYMFTVHANKKLINPVTKAIYRLSYNCLHPTCEKCNPNQQHNILLVNYAKYLAIHVDELEHQMAYANAVKTKEWLVVPTDQVDAYGEPYLSVLPTNIWSTEVFHKALDFNEM